MEDDIVNIFNLFVRSPFLSNAFLVVFIRKMYPHSQVKSVGGIHKGRKDVR